MPTFKDELKRDWVVELNVSQLKAVKSRLGFDLGKITDEKTSGVAEIVSDPVALCNTLYVLCESQCKSRGLSDDDFGRGLAGDSLEAAAHCLIEAFALFCPSQSRPTILRLAEQSRTMQAEMLQLIEKRQNLEARKILDSLRFATDSVE